MGDACEEWLLADLGAQSLGAIVYGIYPTASTEELEYQMIDGGAAIFVAEDQEYVDRILPIADRLPNLRWIVVVDASAMFAYEHPKLKTFDRADARWAAKRDAATLEALARRPAIPRRRPSSSTPPAPRAIRRARWSRTASTWPRRTTWSSTIRTLAEQAHRTVAYLPLCHILGRDIAVTLPLLSKLVPHFGEDVEDLPRTFFEVAPTVLFTVPRYLQKFASQVLVGIGNTSPVKRAAYELAMRVARAPGARALGRTARANRSPTARRARSCSGRCSKSSASTELELVISGGAPLPPETMALWQMWGVNVCEIYGQTEEAGAIITGQRGTVPADRATSAPSPPASRLQLVALGRDPGARRILLRRLLEQPGGDARGARRRTAGCTPATSASWTTAA